MALAGDVAAAGVAARDAAGERIELATPRARRRLVPRAAHRDGYLWHEFGDVHPIANA